MIRTIAAAVRALRRRIQLARYNDFTIAELLRRQGARVGENCRILIRSLEMEPFLISIGNHCTIAKDVQLITHDGGGWIFTDEIPSLQSFGRIDVGDNCFIGMRAMILPNVRIGPNSVVGAGAVVTRDVPPNTVVAGCPAAPICTTDQYREKLLQSWETQRPPGYFDDLKPGVKYSAAYLHQRKLESLSLLHDHLKRTVESSPGKNRVRSRT
jgi:acetyltransferase-like isoleucine patch superfamily enzyme